MGCSLRKVTQIERNCCEVSRRCVFEGSSVFPVSTQQSDGVPHNVIVPITACFVSGRFIHRYKSPGIRTNKGILCNCHLYQFVRSLSSNGEYPVSNYDHTRSDVVDLLTCVYPASFLDSSTMIQSVHVCSSSCSFFGFSYIHNALFSSAL